MNPCRLLPQLTLEVKAVHRVKRALPPPFPPHQVRFVACQEFKRSGGCAACGDACGGGIVEASYSKRDVTGPVRQTAACGSLTKSARVPACASVPSPRWHWRQLRDRHRRQRPSSTHTAFHGRRWIRAVPPRFRSQLYRLTSNEAEGHAAVFRKAHIIEMGPVTGPCPTGPARPRLSRQLLGGTHHEGSQATITRGGIQGVLALDVGNVLVEPLLVPTERVCGPKASWNVRLVIRTGDAPSSRPLAAPIGGWLRKSNLGSQRAAVARLRTRTKSPTVIVRLTRGAVARSDPASVVETLPQ